MNESPDPRKSLEALIEHFEQNLYTLKSPQYNETQARREFIDPLFALLGWDMDNRQGYAEAYKDVIHEDAIKVGGYTKAPDYCFLIGGATPKEFYEKVSGLFDRAKEQWPGVFLGDERIDMRLAISYG